jgi:hypothetical protein
MPTPPSLPDLWLTSLSLLTSLGATTSGLAVGLEGVGVDRRSCWGSIDRIIDVQRPGWCPYIGLVAEVLLGIVNLAAEARD